MADDEIARNHLREILDRWPLDSEQKALYSKSIAVLPVEQVREVIAHFERGEQAMEQFFRDHPEPLSNN